MSPRAPAPATVTRSELLVDGSDAVFRKLIHASFGFLARHEAVRANFGQRIGLSGVEYTVLVAIGHLTGGGGAVIISQLAAHLHLSGAFVTTTTSRLVKKGLITKDVDPDDRRKICLNLTEKAWSTLAALAPIQQQVNDIEFSPLSAGELPRIVALFENLIESSEKALKLQEFLKEH